MNSGRQTRRKSYGQATEAPSSQTSKEKKSVREKSSPISKKATSENPGGGKSKNQTKKKKSEGKEKDNSPNEQSPLEEPVKKDSKPINKEKERDKVSSIVENKNNPTLTKREKSPKSRNIDNVSEEVRKQIEMLFEIAQSSATKGDYNKAINIYNKIVKLNEKSIPAHIALGHCYSAIGDNFKALTAYQHALNISPDSQKDDQLWYGIGLLYKKIDDKKNSETAFRTALKLNPSSTIKGELLYHLGIIIKEKDEPKEAIKILTHAILTGSFSIDKMVEILCIVGQLQEEVDEVSEAMKSYKQALTLDENNLNALQYAGWLSFQLERTNEALEYLTKASLINEEDTNILYMQSRCYLKLKQYNKAYDCLHKCLTKDSNNSSYWCSLGILFSEMNQLKSAQECFVNALKFNPLNAENYFNLGCLYELCYQLKDALAMHEKAIEIQPTFQLAHTRKLGIYAQMENKDSSFLEVQFKHHRFILNLEKELPKEKMNFPILPVNESDILPSSDTILKNPEFFTERELNKIPQKRQEELDVQKILSFPQQEDIFSAFKDILEKKEDEKWRIKPEIYQSEEFQTLVKFFEKKQNESLQKTQDISFSGSDGPLSHNFFGEALNDSKDKKNKESTLGNNIKEESKDDKKSNKTGKGISHPIVLRHDPQIFQQQELENPLKKTGFKLIHKLEKMEDLAPTKKVKLDNINAKVVSPQQEIEQDEETDPPTASTPKK